VKNGNAKTRISDTVKMQRMIFFMKKEKGFVRREI